jgi:hypothetical protein
MITPRSDWGADDLLPDEPARRQRQEQDPSLIQPIAMQ